MKEIEFDTSKNNELDLNKLQEGSITIKEIEAEEFDMLNQIFFIKTTYLNREIKSTIVLNSYLTPMSRKPIVELNYKIEDSDNSIIIAKHDLKTKYKIRYETLEDKINQMKGKNIEEKINIDNEVEKWQNSIKNLYSEIEKWIAPLKHEIKIDKHRTLIQEEYTGTYEVEQSIITLFNGITISFIPIGTFILASKGRIDINVSGRFKDSLMLILQRKENVDNWQLIFNRDHRNSKNFNKAQLFNLIENVIR